jgi:MFS family permease
MRETLDGATPPAGPVRIAGRIPVPRTFAALANDDFRQLWTGTLGSFLAMQMQMVARGYLVYKLTGSATLLGLVILSRGLPQLLFTLWGGVLADRVSKRNLLLVTQSATGLVALTTAVLVSTNQITIWQLVVLGLLEGAIFSFNMPSRQAFIVELVPQQDMMNALALNTAGMNFTRIFGPSLAGLLITVPFIGLEKVFFFVAACYLLPFVMLLRIKPKFAAATKKRRGSMVQELTGGLRYIARHEVLAMLLLLGFIPIILGFPYQMLLPVFAGPKVHDVGASGLGLMSTFAGLGALVGALGVASITDLRRRGLAQILTGVGFGVSLMFFALAPSFHFALAALLFTGFAGSVYQSLNTTLITMKSDKEYLGRVMSVNQLGFSMTMLAPLPVGIVVDHFGAPTTIAAAGGLIVLCLAFVGMFVSSYRRVEADDAPERVPVGQAGSA